jgi:hypothetical protein
MIRALGAPQRSAALAQHNGIGCRARLPFPVGARSSDFRCLKGNGTAISQRQFDLSPVHHQIRAQRECVPGAYDVCDC